MSTPELLTTDQAAERLGLSPHSVRVAVTRGTLKRAYRSLFDPAEVERYKREHLGRVGKRKKAA